MTNIFTPRLIKGNIHDDERGRLFFNNQADLSQVKRLYFIEHADMVIIRAWQAHKKENKWFQVVNGKFELTLIKVNWINPEKSESGGKYILEANNNEILHVPGGFASGFRALENSSKMMVCSDFTLEESKNDDFRFPADQWDI